MNLLELFPPSFFLLWHKFFRGLCEQQQKLLDAKLKIISSFFYICMHVCVILIKPKRGNEKIEGGKKGGIGASVSIWPAENGSSGSKSEEGTNLLFYVAFTNSTSVLLLVLNLHQTLRLVFPFLFSHREGKIIR